MIASHVERALWPADRLADAMAQLARAAGLSVRDGAIDPAPASNDRATLDAWLEGAARSLRLEVDAIGASVDTIGATLAGASPAIVTVGSGDAMRFAVVVQVRGSVASLVRPDGSRGRAPIDALVDAVRGDADPRVASRVDGILDRASVAPTRRARARRTMVETLLAGRTFDIGWSVGLPPDAPFAARLRDAGVFASARTMIAMHLALQALSIAGWWLVGRGALEGQIERGWLVAWGLVLLSAVPPRAIAAWAQGSAALRFAILLKRRLLNGALRLEQDEVRDQGAGALLGRVIESEAVESLVTTGGIATLLALVDAAVAAVVVSLAPGGALAAVAFAVCIALGVLLARAVGRHVADWTHARLEMTQDLIERMVGHRTRLAQEPRARWHHAEDDRLARYAARSAKLDRANAWMQGALARAWLVVGVAAIAPSFVRGASSGAALAASIGGLLLGYRAIARISAGAASLLRARVAWQSTRPLFEAGAREERAGTKPCSAPRPANDGAVLLEARDLSFRYPSRHDPVLRGVSFKVGARDRILLEGPSGGGKSTLGAVLTGLRAPSSGLLLLDGLDPQTLGATGWRRRVVAAPQFHENHLVSATLAFNVLMGRGWPPRRGDLAEAEEVCRELGLGPLLDRMPSGMLQIVGETGWQLSHGERSRVFIARALLQRADMIVLDESFAALDPETLDRAMRCVMRRAPALVVIAHP